MPVTPTYPGVYIEEVPSGVRTITGVATSITAFLGRALRGPVNKAVVINSYADFERIFGGLWVESTLGYAVRDFYLNGGSQGIVVRLFHPTFASEDDRSKVEAAAKEVVNAVAGADAAAAGAAARAKADAIKADNTKSQPEKDAAEAVAVAAEAAAKLPAASVDSVKAQAGITANALAPRSKSKIALGALALEAAYEGEWGSYLRIIIDVETSEEVARRLGLSKADLFNLTIRDAGAGGVTERFLNVSTKESPRRIDKVLEAESRLVRWDGVLDPRNPPDITGPILAAQQTFADKEKQLAELLKSKKPDDPDVVAARKAVDEARRALLDKTVDKVTWAEGRLAAAKKAIEAKTNPTEEEKKAVVDAQKAVADAQREMADAVNDGLPLTIQDFLPPNGEAEKKGLYALEQADLFNLLCIPPYTGEPPNVDYPVLIDAAAAYCEKRRAMLLVDPPAGWKTKDDARTKIGEVGTRHKNTAIFFPRLKQPNPLRGNQIDEFVPCGAVAGIMARTDVARGVWKSPAGLEATLIGVPQLAVNLTDPENGELNPLGINCLRAFPVAGRVVWGARTLRGADQLADEWKYLAVRRMALFLEESLYRGTQWVVFEPNDEPLWAQIRLNVGAFMHNLFRQGAFQGKSPREAYLVKCDGETTNQNHINLGIVNIIVGFAPLKPAEFVIIKIQQLAGQIES